LAVAGYTKAKLAAGPGEIRQIDPVAVKSLDQARTQLVRITSVVAEVAEIPVGVWPGISTRSRPVQGQKLEPGRVLRNLPDGVSPQARQRESHGTILPSRRTTGTGDSERRPRRRAGVICLVQAADHQGVSTREWYHPQPPPRTFRWSMRDNVNCQEAGHAESGLTICRARL